MTTALFEQTITSEDCNLELYGYALVRWRIWLMRLLSVFLVGTPQLLFHWAPTWRVYVTATRAPLHMADIVLIVETYQKKFKEHFIHNIKTKVIYGDDEAEGVENCGYEDDGGGRRVEKPRVAAGAAPLLFDDGTVESVRSYKYIEHKKLVLAWQSSRGIFAPVRGLEPGRTCAQLRSLGAPAPAARRAMRAIYGANEIAVAVRSVGALVLLEVFNPFYVFQAFTVAVWLADNYYYYCGAVVLMSTVGVATSVVQTRTNQRQLRATVEAHDTVILAGPTGGAEGAREVDSRSIAPGDVILLPTDGCVLHADLVLLDGSAVVNESMLTGESVPVTKTSLPNEDRLYTERDHAAHTLYCGTELIQTRYFSGQPVRALVIRTGYNTSKGQLVRSIMYPAPADFEFDRDTYKFIGVLAVLASMGLAYAVAIKSSRHLDPGDIAIKALDIITIVIPPALPAAMTVGRLYAVSRLRLARVYCVNTRAVNVSGSVDCVAFDKTGTLTEDGLDLWGVVPVSHAHLAPPERDPRALGDLHELKVGMAACHSLKLIRGELKGDPLDVKMFESTGWTLEEPDVPDAGKYDLFVPTVVRPAHAQVVDYGDTQLPLEVGVVQIHQFVSALQRSSVVCRVLGEDAFRVYCKGSPEMVRSLCVKESVPSALDAAAGQYAARGYRVLALASKVLAVQGVRELKQVTRERVESELTFRGLIVLENRLKPQTPAVIRQLRDAQLHVVMITGDNIHTAVSVALECGLVRASERLVTLETVLGEKDSAPLLRASSTRGGEPLGSSTLSLSHSVDSGRFSWTTSGSEPPSPRSPACPRSVESGLSAPDYKVAMSGDTWAVLRAHYPSLVPQLVARGAVFARMSSDQKQQLVMEYRALGHYVAMCGDGANDCGALRAAHTGVSLSDLESSVAAPFTSRDRDVGCVVRVLREGRAALVTSFGIFKFMVAYSLTEFFSVAFLYYFDANLTDLQFLFIDVAIILTLAAAFGKTQAFDGPLHPRPPLASLFALSPLASLAGQMALVAAAQVAAYCLLAQFPWYVRHAARDDHDYASWENYTVYTVSTFQYITVAVVFSHGAPYRRSVATNAWLVVAALALTALCVYVAVAPPKWLATLFQLKMPPEATLAYLILGVAAMHAVLALWFERFVVQFLLEEKRLEPRWLAERRARRTPHLAYGKLLTSQDYLDCSVQVQRDSTRV